MELNAYYIPAELSSIEDKIKLKELEIDSYIINFPKINRDIIKELIVGLKKQRKQLLASITDQQIEQLFDNVTKKWMNRESSYRKIALDILPKLTGLSKEIIIHYQFETMRQMTGDTVRKLLKMEINKEMFSKFTRFNDTNALLRAFMPFRNKLKLKKALKNLKKPEFITFITPSNVPGLIEALAVFLTVISKSASIIKSPSKQPVFGPLYARSIAEEDYDLAQLFSIIPWKGGTYEIEKELFWNSDAVSVISSTETAMSVKERIDNLNRKGNNIIGCYHGGKFGLDVISKEYAKKEIAALAVFDGIGYEGYMCSSPAFGYFIETGGELTPKEFAKEMARVAKILSEKIPQGELFRRYRDNEIAKLLAKIGTKENTELLMEHGYDYAVFYQEEIELIPNGQNRLFKVFPIDSIMEIPRLFKDWRIYLQSIGVAIPKSRLISFANEAGRAGFSNIRVLGTLTIPRLGEAWDGNLPVLEFMMDNDLIHWTSINTIDIDKDLEDQVNKIYQKFLKTS
ncbi:MAG: acyl-CoA reductase [Candidatus Njordarchaeales archaeon]